jgi:hypothetical protein
MGLAGLSDVLDDVDPLRQLDRRGRDVGELVVHLGGLGGHVSHRHPLQQGVDWEGGDGEKSQPPVHHEGIDEQYERNSHGCGLLNGRMGDEHVDLDGVVLDGLAHPTG